MIEIIIKRNGEEEPFAMQKLMGWGEWAASTLNGRVDWQSVVRAVLGRVKGPKVKSIDLQSAFIDECLSRNTWSYYLMAGRLYAADQHKNLYGSEGIPTIAQLHLQMQNDKMLRQLDYSPLEYAELEELIDHSYDYTYPHFSLKYMHEKYAFQNRVTGKVYETPQFVYMRMAMVIYEKEPRAIRLQQIREIFDHFRNKELSAPTPNYVYLGAPRMGLASCCLFSTADDGESLATGDYIANIMTQAGAGIGSNIITRSVGEPVRGGSIKHGGKLGYYRANAFSTTANKQGSRGGAGNVNYPIFDPEAPVISQLRNPRAIASMRIRELHYTVQSNPYLDYLASQNKPIMAFTCNTAPDLFEAFYSSDLQRFVELYNKYENDPSFKKKYLDARALVYTMAKEAYETGTAYFNDMYEINHHTPFKEPIYNTNLCVAPETKILTDNGYVEIQSVAGSVQNIWNGREWSEVEVLKTGEDQELLMVITDSGQTLECTPYHKFFVVDGYGTEACETRAHNLKPGDKLIKFDMPVIEGADLLANAYINGFYTGDGCETPEGQRVYLYGNKRLLADRFVGGTDWRIQNDHNRMYKHYNTLECKFFVPDNRYTVQSRLDWLSGLADADGCIYRNGDNQQLIVTSVNYAFLQEVQYMLNTLGVVAKIKPENAGGARQLPLNDGTGKYGEFECQATWRLIIASNDLQHLLSLGITFGRLKVLFHQPQRDAKQFIKIAGVVNTGRRDDTYCFTEHKRHMGIFNGILTGQCVEIAEPTKPYMNAADLYLEEDHGRGEVALCSLFAVNVNKADTTKKVESVCYHGLRMVDFCIHNSDYKLPHIGFTAKQRMNAAGGIMGLASHMAKNRLTYTSAAGLQEIHFIYERHMYCMIKASLRIAKERGNAPWINKTKWPEGWLPIDTYNRNVDKLGDFDCLFPWEKLRQEIIQQGGIAHSCLVGHMPGESSSKALGETNSGYAVRKKAIKKTDGQTVIYWAAPESDNPDYFYELAYDIPVRRQAECYAVQQKWTDQAISADFYRRINPEEKLSSTQILEDEYFYPKSLGMKSRYYQNSEITDGIDLEGAEAVEIMGSSNCPSGACSV